MRGIKILFGTTALLAGLALMPAAQAQVVINLGVQPSCAYGYYDYAPYACSPYGYYGPGYFYNGIFLGMGPWAGWGYGHGWGGHRFTSDGGGSYAAAAAQQPIAAILHAAAAERVPARVTFKRCAPALQLPIPQLRALQHRARRLRMQRPLHTQLLAGGRTVAAAVDTKAENINL